MKSKHTIIIILSETNIKLAQSISAKMINSEIHSLNIKSDLINFTFSSLSKHLRSLQKDKFRIIAICSIGIIIRSLNSNFLPKKNGCPIVVLSSDGKYAIPLLESHSGGNKLASELAKIINCQTVITTLSDAKLEIALDDPPEGYILNPECNYKGFISRLLKEGSVNKLPRLSWLIKSKIELSDKSELNIESSIFEKSFNKDTTLLYHPQKLVIGVGSVSGASSNKLYKFIMRVLKDNNLSIHSIAAFATIDIKRNEKAINQLGKKFKKPILYYSSSELESVSHQLPSPSEYVYETVGSHGVAEPAALLAAGKGSRIIVEKQKIIEATCSVVSSRRIKDFSFIEEGVLSIIGLGPGDENWRTYEVENIIKKSTHLVGFSGYLKQIRKTKNKKFFPYEIGQEEDRAKKAMELANEGKSVALVCSGDPGIYAMGSVVFELIDKGGKKYKEINVNITPSISAFQAASARVGAPFGNDFCIISLSNLLTPEDVIMNRLYSALTADFVIGIYNPSSRKRKKFFLVALEKIKKNRSGDTPIVIARDIGRKTEKIRCIKLRDIDPNEIDMFTMLIIGSRSTKEYQTADLSKRIYTPRGYNLDS